MNSKNFSELEYIRLSKYFSLKKKYFIMFSQNATSKQTEKEKRGKKEELKSLKVKNWIEEKERKEKKEKEKKILEEMETPCIAIMENNEGETIQIRVKIPGNIVIRDGHRLKGL